MTDMDSAGLALLALVVATAVHAGFQLTVTTVVYPALARVDTDRWSTAHDAHSRSIVPVVAVTYLSLAGACLWAVLAVPSSAWVWTVGAGAALAGVTTPWSRHPRTGRLLAGVGPIWCTGS